MIGTHKSFLFPILALFCISLSYASNHALDLDGSDDYIDGSSTLTSSEFTVEAWVKPALVNVNQVIISTMDEAQHSGIELFLGSNSLTMLIPQNNSWTGITATPLAIQTDAWIHVAGTCGNNTCKIYLSGDSVAALSTSTIAMGTSPIRIGRRSVSSSGPYYFHGAVDEVQIWNTMRTSDQIRADLIGYETPQVGQQSYYKCNQGAAGATNTGFTSLYDLAGNHNMTLSNFALTGSTSNWVDGYRIPQSIFLSGIADMSPGDTLALTATATSGQAVTLTSSDPSVVKIENDKLIALKVGSVTITANEIGDSIWTQATTESSITVHPMLGSGTSVDPYLIGNYEQLKMMGTQYPLTASYRLTRDIDASVSASTPFPCILGDFTGNFHGGGHRIRNLTVSGPAIFKRLATGVIDSVGFININVLNGNGGIAGILLNATMHASYVTGKITGSNFTGGLVAQSQSSKLDSCFFSGIVSGGTVGGLIGYSEPGTVIANSYATGTVIGTSDAGGLIGASEKANIRNSYSTAWVSALQSNGGIIGVANNAQLSDIWVAGHVDQVGFSGYTLGNSALYSFSNVIADFQAVGPVQSGKGTGEMYTTYQIFSKGGYKGIDGVMDAPFAFLNRSISIGTKAGQRSKILQTAISVDNTPFPLVVRIDSLCGKLLDTANGDLQFVAGTAYGTYDSLFFTAGAIQASGDTLWGNKVKAVVEFVSNADNIGTESNPHMLYSYQNLQNIRANPSHTFKLANDIDASASSQESFHPIGDCNDSPNLGAVSPCRFFGVLHGDGHSISNLTIVQTTNSSTGLFVSIQDIDSLSLTNAVIKGNSSEYTGGFAGELGGIIQDCFFSGSVQGSKAAGAFVGKNDGTILRSHNTGSVTGTHKVGGIAGTNTGLISDTYNSGIVTGDSVGGIVGYNFTQTNTASVQNSYNVGAVQGTNAGGIVGINTSIVANCHFDSTLVGQQDSTKGKAQSTQEMKDIRTYTYWDFSNTWLMDNGKSYPTLAWQVPQHGPTTATSIILQHPDTLRLIVTQQMQLSVASLPAGSPLPKLVYSTSDANIVQVDTNGLLTASIQNTTIAKIMVTVPNSTMKDSLWVKVYGQAFAGGDGSESNPFQIETISQLDSIRLFSGSHFLLMNDLDMDTSLYAKASGNSWNPLTFKGKRGLVSAAQEILQFFLDGQGHVIRNLYVNNKNGGFFLQIHKSQIKNLGFENASIKGVNSGVLGFRSDSSTVSQVYVKGSIANSANAGGFLMSSNKDTISDCYAMVSVSTTRDAAGFSYNLTGKISNSYSVGTVTAPNKTAGFTISIAPESLTNSFYDMTVSGFSDASNGTPKTTAELKTEATFSDANWNLQSATNPSATWALSSDCNDGYPCFTWQFKDPEVSTDVAQSIQNTSAEIVGTIHDLSAYPIARHGFVWSTRPNPVVDVDSTQDFGTSTATSAFSSIITKLSPHTKYYVRAFATSAAGTGYGTQLTFTTANTLPTIANGTLNILEDHAINISLDTLHATDADGDSMKVLLQTGDNYALAGHVVTPSKNFFGTLEVPYKVTDGIDTTSLSTISIHVEAVNDAPSFVAGSDPATITNKTNEQIISKWATSIFSGATNESSQTLTFHVTCTNPSIFLVQPAISSSGELSFTPAKKGNGTSTVSVRLMDNGGTTNGGVDSSDVSTFEITIKSTTTRIADAETAPFIDKGSIPTFDLLGRKAWNRIQPNN